MFVKYCRLCRKQREHFTAHGIFDYGHYIDVAGREIPVCKDCYTRQRMEETSKRKEIEKKMLETEIVCSFANRIAELNALLTKEKTENKNRVSKFERKYNRYYHLVGDFYEYLFKIDKVKEFTLFHEEKEIKREGD